MGIDGESGEVEAGLGPPEAGLGLLHLALQALHVLQGDVQEVPRAARRVEYPHLAQPAVKGLQLGRGGVGLALLVESQRRDLDRRPLLAQGLHHGGEHQALHVGSGGVVRPQLVALRRVQRPLQQGAEDSRFHLLPVRPGGLEEQRDLALVQGQGGGLLEQPAVEAAHRDAKRGGKAPRGHLLPQLFDGGGERRGGAPELLQQAGEALGRQQPHVLGEHRKEAPHEEAGRGVGVVSRRLQAAGEPGQPVGDLPGDPGAAPGGVQRQGIGPHPAQGFPDPVVGQLVEEDAVTPGLGEGHIRPAGPRELGKKLDGVAHVDHHHEGRPPLGGRQGAGVGFGLPAGAEHGAVPRPGAAHGGALLAGARLLAGRPKEGEQPPGLLGLLSLGALLGLQDEGAAAVQVDEAGAGGAVAVAEGDAALEDVGVVGVVRDGGIGVRHPKQVAQLSEKELVVGPLRAARRLPFGDEVLARHVLPRLVVGETRTVPALGKKKPPARRTVDRWTLLRRPAAPPPAPRTRRNRRTRPGGSQRRGQDPPTEAATGPGSPDGCPGPSR